jgi:hypothetical protein
MTVQAMGAMLKWQHESGIESMRRDGFQLPLRPPRLDGEDGIRAATSAFQAEDASSTLAALPAPFL